MREFAPGLKLGAAGRGTGEGGTGEGACPPPMKPRMSFFVTRPETPEPWIWEMSTLFSAAILRTSGEDLVRRRSSREVTFSGSAIGFGGGAAALGGSGAAVGLGSGFASALGARAAA